MMYKEEKKETSSPTNLHALQSFVFSDDEGDRNRTDGKFFRGKTITKSSSQMFPPIGLKQSLVLESLHKTKLKNIITIKGRSYTKADILQIKAYFDSINESKSGKITIDEYVKTLSKSPYLKRVAVSLFNFLDKNSDGCVSFLELLHKLAPGAKKCDIDTMMGWIEEENKIHEKAQSNYKMITKIRVAKLKQKKRITFKQIKDFLHIFVLYDKNGDGKLTVKELKEALRPTFSVKEIEQMFEKYVKDKDQVLELEQFLQMVIPQNYIVTNDLLKNYCFQYVEKIKCHKGILPV